MVSLESWNDVVGPFDDLEKCVKYVHAQHSNHAVKAYLVEQPRLPQGSFKTVTPRKSRSRECKGQEERHCACASHVVLFLLMRVHSVHIILSADC